MPNFMNMRFVGSVLFHMEGRTDVRMHRYDGTISRFSEFWERASLYIYVYALQSQSCHTPTLEFYRPPPDSSGRHYTEFSLMEA